MNLSSTLLSLKDIVDAGNWRFSIPIYQRLYVWGDNQVKTLLSDFANAEKESEDIFFLGGTLIVERHENGEKHFELIDGQQRFTTLWILSHAWKEALESFIAFHEGDKTLTRIYFSIRHEVNCYLQSLALNAPQELTNESEKQTEKMRDAVKQMETFLSDQTKDFTDTQRLDYTRKLTDFIFNKVKIVVTKVPAEMDLNKLFEVINNRGVQLQHHEILKAKMLDVLIESERPIYACLWESCADMDRFIERNLSSIVGKSLRGRDIADLFHKDASKTDQEKLRESCHVVSLIKPRLESTENELALSLDEILKNPQSHSGSLEQVDNDNEDGSWARSVIGFPLLLQHVLRIWLHEREMKDLPKLLDRELLALFDENFFAVTGNETQQEAVKSFIHLLWEIRYLFDKHVIKWANPDGEDEIQQITTMRLIDPTEGTRSINREKTESSEARELGMIQSFLYHSQEITTHYWLTPFLNFIHKQPSSVKDYTKYLKHLDSCLLGSVLDDKLVERTRRFLDDPWTHSPSRHENSLIKGNGVHFWSYWFYKLEFVLWCNRDNYADSDDRWKNFRFTAKNSVEHISPQTPTERDFNKVDDMLDHFGNLALVSRSINSEYSNLPYNEKRQRFKNNNSQKLDSLKMDIIYRNELWSDKIARQHQDEMIKLLTQYYEDHSTQPQLGTSTL